MFLTADCGVRYGSRVSVEGVLLLYKSSPSSIKSWLRDYTLPGYRCSQYKIAAASTLGHKSSDDA